MSQRFIICMLLISIQTFSHTMASSSSSSKEKAKSKKRKAPEISAAIDETTSQHPLLQLKKPISSKPTRVRNVYKNKKEGAEFLLSRSKLENFLRCPACFHADRYNGVNPPSSFPFTLNCKWDSKEKTKYDKYRESQTMPPLCAEYDAQAEENGYEKIHAIPFQHADIEKWRNSLHHGLKYLIPGTDIVLQGGVDDIWENQETKELIVADYKATSKNGEVTLDADWQDGYKRQLCIYQYLLRKQGFKVSNTGFFVYANAQTTDTVNMLDFKTTLIPYTGDDSWVEPTVVRAYQCLQSSKQPKSSPYCEMCKHIDERIKATSDTIAIKDTTGK